MRILSTGDFHIGTECDRDVLSSARYITHKAAEIKPDLIIINGDIYDGESNPDTRNIAADIVANMANESTVFIVKGNHDTIHDLIILGGLKARNHIRVFEKPATILSGDIAIHLLPWATKASWIASKEGVEAGIETGDKSVSTMALTYLRGMIANNPAKKHLLFGHLMIAGARAENHQPLLGEGITFGYHDLVECGFAGGAFGHIHLAQKFGDCLKGNPEFWYNGSVATLNYGEIGLSKQFSVLNVHETLTWSIYELKVVARINLDAIWDGKLNPEFYSQLHTLDKSYEMKIRVKLLIEEGYQTSDGETAVKEAILNFCQPQSIKIETQRRPKTQVRSQEIAAAKTARQKIEAYWDATDTVPAEPMRTDILAIVDDLETECTINK